MKEFIPPKLPLDFQFQETTYKKLILASRELSELKGIAKTIPNQEILINTLSLQEAKDSSEIENIITTHDELFLSAMHSEALSKSAKEVQNYAKALKIGFKLIQAEGLLRTAHILKMQQILEGNHAGFGKQAGTTLKNQKGEIKYIPPQNPQDILTLMDNLEQYINDDSLQDLDPLIKMAIIHYQFESIHPFYDGNGRTGRIINILYLVHKQLLDLPILYLSGYILKHKQDYYTLLEEIRDQTKTWKWINFMLEGIIQTSKQSIQTIKTIKSLSEEVSQILQHHEPKLYSKDFVEMLFIHPYTKIEFIQKSLKITRQTASRYLKTCEKLQILHCLKFGRSNYYINTKLFKALQKGF